MQGQAQGQIGNESYFVNNNKKKGNQIRDIGIANIAFFFSECLKFWLWLSDPDEVGWEKKNREVLSIM